MYVPIAQRSRRDIDELRRVALRTRIALGRVLVGFDDAPHYDVELTDITVLEDLSTALQRFLERDDVGEVAGRDARAATKNPGLIS